MSTEKTGKCENISEPSESRDKAGRFVPGQSGNPGGYPAGMKHRSTTWSQLSEKCITEQDRKEVVDKLLEAAKAGERWAVQYLADREFGTPTNKQEHSSGDHPFELVIRDLKQAQADLQKPPEGEKE